MLDSYIPSIGLFILLLSCPLFLLAQIPNSSFEEWAMSSQGFNEPEGWETNNFKLDGEDYVSVYRDTVSIHGQYSIAMTGNFPTIEGLCPGGTQIRLKEDDFPDQPVALRAWVKCSMPNENNKGICRIYVHYFKDREPIIDADWRYFQNTDGFEEVRIPLSASEFDSIGITLQGGSVISPLGCRGEATMWVDSLAFDYTTTKTQSIQESASIKIFPNPAKEKIHIRKTDKAIASYRFFNVLGQPLQSQRLEHPSATFSITVGQLPPGVYFLELLNVDKQQIIRKITKQ
ncbi:MAG: T9SS type A sorting domain-containing protein [Bacteroidota bacterium]